jgi:hypothetical protein
LTLIGVVFVGVKQGGLQSCPPAVATFPSAQYVIQLVVSACPIIITTKGYHSLEIKTVFIGLVQAPQTGVYPQITLKELFSACIGIPHCHRKYRVGNSVARPITASFQFPFKRIPYSGFFGRIATF